MFSEELISDPLKTKIEYERSMELIHRLVKRGVLKYVKK